MNEFIGYSLTGHFKQSHQFLHVSLKEKYSLQQWRKLWQKIAVRHNNYIFATTSNFTGKNDCILLLNSSAEKVIGEIYFNEQYKIEEINVD